MYLTRTGVRRVQWSESCKCQLIAYHSFSDTAVQGMTFPPEFSMKLWSQQEMYFSFWLKSLVNIWLNPKEAKYHTSSMGGLMKFESKWTCNRQLTCYHYLTAAAVLFQRFQWALIPTRNTFHLFAEILLKFFFAEICAAGSLCSFPWCRDLEPADATAVRSI